MNYIMIYSTLLTRELHYIDNKKQYELYLLMKGAKAKAIKYSK